MSVLWMREQRDASKSEHFDGDVARYTKLSFNRSRRPDSRGACYVSVGGTAGHIYSGYSLFTPRGKHLVSLGKASCMEI